MKVPSFIILFLLSLGLAIQASAQSAARVGYINSKTILSQMQEYQEAQTEVDKKAQEWQQELEKLHSEIKELKEDLIARSVIMDEQEEGRMLAMVLEKETLAKEQREKWFGYNGELFHLQENRVQPVKDKLFAAVEKVAKRKRRTIVFDKAGEVTWLFTNAKHDLTDDVLIELGLKEKEGAGGGFGQTKEFFR